MNRFLRASILSIAVAATTLSSLPAADAGQWRGRHSDNRDLAVAGIVGLAAGALVLGLANRHGPEPLPEPVYRDPSYDTVYQQPRPRPVRHYPVYDGQDDVYDRDGGSLEPWTRDWFDYCSDRYRTFNPRTGTFRDYDGARHFCVAD